MAQVVGVRFKPVGKVYHFDPQDVAYVSGDPVVVETARGEEFGHVVIPSRQIPDIELVGALKRVLRMATPEDLKQAEDNKILSREAFAYASERIEARHLDMSLVDVEVAFDHSKMLFLFTAENRIDFRDLVRDLAQAYKGRIELRQIGARDEAKILGGIGPCGRILCCTSFLTEFKPVSVRMAKAQHLALNPSKISGVCGRLMCCLRYEYVGSTEDEPEEDSFAWRVREAHKGDVPWETSSTSSAVGTAASTQGSARTRPPGSNSTRRGKGRGTRGGGHPSKSST